MNANGDSTFQYSLNQSLQAFTIQFEHFIGIALKTVALIKGELSKATENWISPIAFTPLQFTLFKVLLILIFGTLVLIVYAWHTFGNVITEKFVRPSTVKEIEELKLSVAKLKLPKEHSPRI